MESSSTTPATNTPKKKTKILYPHAVMDRIGHLAGELNYLRNVFFGEEYEIEIVTMPLEDQPKINRAMFEVATRGLNVTFCDNKNIIDRLTELQKNPVVHKDDTIFNLNVHDTFYAYSTLAGRNKKQPFTFSLTDEEKEKGLRMRQELNIPLDAPIITLHVREGGYLPELAYHSFRDANIDNYLPAILYLINEGYYVVRIGDSTMKPFPIEHPQLINGPTCRFQGDLFEPYFISESEFYIGMLSGPINIAMGFEVPILVINAQICGMTCVYDKGLICPKEIYSEQLQRMLTYPEIALSPISEMYLADEFSKNNLRFVENPPEIIEAVVREMHSKIKGTYLYNEVDELFDQRTRQINRMASLFRQNDDKLKNTPFCMDITDSRFSGEFLKSRPYYLGHLCKDF